MPDFDTPSRAVTPALSPPAGGGAMLQDETVADVLCGEDLPLIGPQPGTMWAGQGRNPGYAAYAFHLSEVVLDVALIEDAEQRKRLARGLLTQASRINLLLAMGQEIDVSLIPEPLELPFSASPADAMPPEWVRSTRTLLGLADQFLETRDTDSLQFWMGDDLIGLGSDAADYGVPLYRTQSDNLASPDATCNTTSMAMALERLGYDRQDVIRAIERELKIRELRAIHGRRHQPTDEEIAAHELADDAWQQAAQRFFDQEQGRGSGYQRLRSGTVSDREERDWAPVFRDQAQMEDLVHMLINMMGIERTEINVGDHPQEILDAVHGESPLAETTAERLAVSRWATVAPTVRQCLHGGGAATLSVDHKSHGTAGSHIVTIQEVRSDGIVVDDPYGRVHAGFAVDRQSHGDAYMRGGSRVLRDPGAGRWTANRIDADNDADWMRTSARTEDELKGDSSFWPNRQVEAMTNGRYVVLFWKGGRPDTAPAPFEVPHPAPRPDRS